MEGIKSEEEIKKGEGIKSEKDIKSGKEIIEVVKKDLQDMGTLIEKRDKLKTYWFIKELPVLEKWIGQIGLTEERIKHCREVAKVSSYVANQSDCPELAIATYVAGLVHDCGFGIEELDTHGSGFRVLEGLGFRELATVTLLQSNKQFNNITTKKSGTGGKSAPCYKGVNRGICIEKDKEQITASREFERVKADFPELLIISHFVTIANQIVNGEGNYTGSSSFKECSTLLSKYNYFYTLCGLETLYIKSLFSK